MKRNRIVLFILILIATSITLCAESKEQFINVGNIKIIKPQLITINREDITININKNSEFQVESKYWFKNTDNINLRTTYLFSVDQYASATPRKYLKKIEFIDNYKSSEPSRATINFKNDSGMNVLREWYAISMLIKKNEEQLLQVDYTFSNPENKDKFTYNFDLVKNFENENVANILIVTINNNSGKEIDKLTFQNYEFKKIKGNRYKLAIADVNLQGNLEIELKK